MNMNKGKYLLTGVYFLLITLFSYAQHYKPKTVKIDDQIWMAENLDISTFRNGDPIPQAKTNEAWIQAGENEKPAWCYYENDPQNGKKYGKLYNWYAINDPRGLAPKGWHIPKNEEWKKLIDFLGGDDHACAKLKSSYAWKGNGYGSNSSGFTALPGGCRECNGSFTHLGYIAYFWSTAGQDSNKAWYQQLFYGNARIYCFRDNKQAGYSVRLIKN